MTWYIVGVSNVFFIAGGIVGLGAIVSFVGYRGTPPVPANGSPDGLAARGRPSGHRGFPGLIGKPATRRSH